MFTEVDPVESQRLLKRLERTVELEHGQATIAGKNYPWVKVINPDRLLEKALAGNQPEVVELDPFWAATWRAAQGLDEFLGRIPNLRNYPILELGGGSGRAGISAALRGANVCITDASSMAMIMCRYNARFVRDKVTVRKLDWAKLQNFRERFPIVIGSDIVYNPSLYPILEPCMRQVLADDGTIYLSEPQRHTGDRFEHWIRTAGWKCDSELIDLNDGQREIRIFKCRLP